MADYVLYLHGVTERGDKYHEKLHEAIQKEYGEDLRPISVHLSRAIGAQIVYRIYETTIKNFGDVNKINSTEDRLHLITHSWGSIILMDILFADRWEDKEVADRDRERVKTIRSFLFGMGDHPDKGIRLASIATMGSPFAIFRLLYAVGPDEKTDAGSSTRNRHDISKNIRRFFKYRQEHSVQPLRWINFVHPGDPIAYPLQSSVSAMLGETQQSSVQFNDLLVHGDNDLEGKAVEGLVSAFRDTPFSLAAAPFAHLTYWQPSAIVVTNIANTIRAAHASLASV